MKALLMSIHSQWVSKILNGEKTIEIRKKFPKDYVGWVYIYCTKDGQGLVWDNEGKGLVNQKLFPYAKDCPEHNRLLNGKVVARFWCDKVEEIVTVNRLDTGEVILYRGRKEGLTNRELMEGSCLTFKEMNDYLQGKLGCAIHITKLEIFDKPKEISEFNVMREYTNCGRCPHALDFGCSSNDWCRTIKSLTRAPQSWQFIEI